MNASGRSGVDALSSRFIVKLLPVIGGTAVTALVGELSGTVVWHDSAATVVEVVADFSLCVGVPAKGLLWIRRFWDFRLGAVALQMTDFSAAVALT